MTLKALVLFDLQYSAVSADTFVPISALKGMSIKPKVGDFIYFDIESNLVVKQKPLTVVLKK